MKKILLSLFMVLFAAPSFAQYSSGGFSLDQSSLYYGIRLGINFAGIGGDYVDLDSKAGLNMASVVGLRLSDTTPVFLESGLYYTERGAKKKKSKISLTYFELPVLIKYGIQVSDDIAVLPYLGPYFSLGIAGKEKYPAVGDEASYNRSSFKHFKRGDMGIKIGCGAEYNKIYAELGYQFGIANIAKENEHDLEATGHALYMNIGVNF